MLPRLISRQGLGAALAVLLGTAPVAGVAWAATRPDAGGSAKKAPKRKAPPAQEAAGKGAAAKDASGKRGSGPAEGRKPGEDKSPKPIFDENPDEHYEQGDRVDPFTLGKPRRKVPEAPPLPGPGDGDENGKPRPYWGKRLADMLKNYRLTAVILSSETRDRFQKVDSECNKHVPAIKAEIRQLRSKASATDVAEYEHRFQAALEKFERLQATARRLRFRQEVEADFASKNIVVEGIVWRPQAPAAAVNGEMVTEGKILRVGEKGAVIQVYRIKKHSVVFTYRGIQVSAHLPRGSQ
jgi:hypothetical protein